MNTALTVFASLLCAGTVHAQAKSPRRTAVVQTSTSDPNQRSLAAAVEKTLRDELTALEVAEVGTTPAMPLQELQFAVGCMGESPECLAQVAGNLEVDALLLSSVEHAGNAAVLEISLFDHRVGQIQRATRRASGPTADSAVLDQVEGALREIYGLPDAPEPPSAPPSDQTADEVASEVTEAVSSESGGVRGPEPGIGSAGGMSMESGGRFKQILPYVVGGAGVATLGVGLALGMMSSKSEDAFRNAPVTTRREVDEAQDHLDRAERQALTANVLFGVGGALALTSTVLFFTMPRKRDTIKQVVIAPFITGNGGGLVLAGRNGGSR